MSAGSTAAASWTRPRPPTPSTLPPSSWNGVAALMTISITRLLFSSAALVATHWP